LRAGIVGAETDGPKQFEAPPLHFFEHLLAKNFARFS
jgi:hypothetical protein